MKVYVDENDIDILDDLFEATNVYDCWDCNRDDALAIKSLADYTKQVRKEVCERLDKRIHNYLSNKCRYAESLDISSIIKQVMKESLGENKWTH